MGDLVGNDAGIESRRRHVNVVEPGRQNPLVQIVGDDSYQRCADQELSAFLDSEPCKDGVGNVHCYHILRRQTAFPENAQRCLGGSTDALCGVIGNRANAYGDVRTVPQSVRS